jgi:hypothetical protein
MNRSQRIHLNPNETHLDRHIKIRLEQDVDFFEFLSMKIDTKDVYRNFNADYGVLVGRVIANNGIGVPNAKVGIFIPLSDDDSNDSSIRSIYPYKTPRDLNNEGKRYNLLPRVTRFDRKAGANKPKQPFGSFPTKEEILVNESYLNVYKKYYKYTTVTNGSGDYMIFGAPIGTHIVHMSVDITDIGKYSMSPASMIKAGYPANLFTSNNSEIKPSNDLTDLPHIETQEISVDVVPFWGDTENFEIGITRQDFRVKAELLSNFTIFGTTMTMGIYGLFGNPAANNQNQGLYSLDTDDGTGATNLDNNTDIRTYRTAKPTIRLFTYTNDVPILANGTLDTSTVDTEKQIRELDKSEYFEYNENGNFMLIVPCNRVRVITSSTGEDEVIPDDSQYGVFSKFFGMILINYPDLNELPEKSGWSHVFDGGTPCMKARGRLKIPQSIGFSLKSDEANFDAWRKEYMIFLGGSIYSVAQFMPMKFASTSDANIVTNDNTENNFGPAYKRWTAGAWFKVAGDDKIAQSDPYDNINYIIPPEISATSSNFRYDFPANATKFYEEPSDGRYKYFGGQWINFCLMFPQYGFTDDPIPIFGSVTNRQYDVADVYHNDYEDRDFVIPQKTSLDRKLFGGATNVVNLLKPDSFQTAFIEVPHEELTKLLQVPFKGINVRRWNLKLDDDLNHVYDNFNSADIQLSTLPYKYLAPKSFPVLYPLTTGRQYNRFGWDERIWSYGETPAGEPPSAYLFKGMYENDCIKMLQDFNII